MPTPSTQSPLFVTANPLPPLDEMRRCAEDYQHLVSLFMERSVQTSSPSPSEQELFQSALALSLTLDAMLQHDASTMILWWSTAREDFLSLLSSIRQCLSAES